jgi:hypothetical protein
MSDGKYQPLTDMDDLPRTLRREHESRDRAARELAEKEAATRAAWDRGTTPARGVPAQASSTYGAPEPANPYDAPYPVQQEGSDRVTVRRFKVPFFSLMGFFIKAVFAAVPALLILMGMLYGLGLALQAYFPQLIKMKIVITFPG